jgi:streptogramin lyase
MNAYNPGPVNRTRRWLVRIAELLVLPAGILAIFRYLSTYEVGSVCHGNCLVGPPMVTPYGSPDTSGGPIPTPYPINNPEPRGMTAGPDGTLWFTEEQGDRIGRITTSGQVRYFPLPPL